MGLPIAVGSKQSSSRPIRHRSHAEEYVAGPLMAMSVSADKDLSATLTIAYYNIVRKVKKKTSELDDHESVDNNISSTENTAIENLQVTTVAEISVMVSSLTSQFTAEDREAKWRIPLNSRVKIVHPNDDMQSSKSSGKGTSRLHQWNSVSADVTFSADMKHLACLIPHPIFRSSKSKDPLDDALAQRSTVVVFHLKKHRPSTYKTDRPKLSFPSYITADTSRIDNRDEEVGPATIVIPVHPQIATTPEAGDSATLSSITAFCDASPSCTNNNLSGSSVLLAGCVDGTILAIEYRKATLAGILHRPASASTNHRISRSTEMGIKIMSMSHIANKLHSNDRSSGLYYSVGKLVTIQEDGAAVVYKSTFESSSPGIPLHIPHRSSSKQTALVDEYPIHARHQTGSVISNPQETSKSELEDSSMNQEAVEWEHLSHVGEAGGGEHTPDETPTSQQQHRHHGGGLVMKIEQLSCISPYLSSTGRKHIPHFSCALWINFNVLAVLSRPSYISHNDGSSTFMNKMSNEEEQPKGVASEENVAAQVWAIPDNNSRNPWLLSTLKMTAARLVEEAHGTFTSLVSESNPPLHCIHRSGNNSHWLFEGGSSSAAVEYDAQTGCLTLSSVVVTAVAPSSQDKIADDAFMVLSEKGSSLEFSQRYSVIPYVCVWDWKTPAIGLTLRMKTEQHLLCFVDRTSHDSVWAWWSDSPDPFFSQFCLAHDKKKGSLLIHQYFGLDNSQRLRIQKDSYKMGILSPPVLSQYTSYRVEEACPLLISSDTVTFPFIIAPAVAHESTLEWKQSRVPGHYLATYGPIQVAAIEKRMGRSLAVAGSRGLCILDMSRMWLNRNQHRQEGTNIDVDDALRCLNQRYSPCIEGSPAASQSSFVFKNGHPKWRYFGNALEERSFKVHAMSWWEMSVPSPSDAKTPNNSISEDLLFGAIQYISHESPENNKELHLVCWSRRRLGMQQDQLLEEEDHANDHAQDATSGCIGIPLPQGMVPQSISVLAEPQHSDEDSRRESSSGYDKRALLLISCISDNKDTDSNVKYLVYQLHAQGGNNNGKGQVNEKRIRVLGKLCSSGEIHTPDTEYDNVALSQKVSGVFLASGSFNFNLFKQKGGIESNDYTATIGLLRECGGGICAACVTSDGPVLVRQVNMATSSRIKLNTKASGDISKFWLSDIVIRSDLNTSREDTKAEGNSEVLYGAFVWTLAQSNGKIMSWSVPFLRRKSSSSDNTGQNFPLFLGTINSLGNAAVLMSGAATINQGEIALAALPNTCFGSMLYGGQRSSNRGVRDPREGVGVRNSLSLEIFDLGECVVGPPAFTVSLLASLQLTGSLAKDISNRENTNCSMSNSLIMKISRVHSLARLTQDQADDAVTTAFRVILMSMLQTIAKVSKTTRNTTDLTSNEDFDLDLRLAKSFLYELVMAARISLNSLQFASFFVALARQIEPELVVHLFPLPSAKKGRNQSRELNRDVRTIEDIFHLCVESGSLSIASSVLPLFPSQDRAHYRCSELLHHCVTMLQQNIKNASEEKIFIRQLFQFGLKLEDSDDFEDQLRLEEDIEQAFIYPLNTSDSNSSSCSVTGSEFDQSADCSFIEDSDLSHDEPQQRNFICKGTGVSKLFSLLLPFGSKKSPEKVDEKAIQAAASNFLQSGFEETFPDIVIDESGSSGESHAIIKVARVMGDVRIDGEQQPSFESVSGVVARFILPFKEALDETERHLQWRNSAVIALLLVGRRHVPFDAASEEIQRVRSIVESTDMPAIESLINLDRYIDEGRKQNDDGTDSSTKNKSFLVAFLVGQIQLCSHQISDQASGAIFDLAILILSRHDRCNAVQELAPSLVLVAIISGHVSGRVTEILDDSKNPCLLQHVYQSVAKK